MKIRRINFPRCSMTMVGLLVWSALVGCSDPTPSGEVWDIYRLEGSRIGYAHTTIRKETSASGEPLVRTEVLERQTFKRSGTATDMENRVISIETPDGKLLRFEHEMKAGRSPTLLRGRVVGDRLELETTTQGKTSSSSIPWRREYGGPFAVDQSLLRRPMQPGERRTVHALVPVVNQVAAAELTARDYESVELPAGTKSLLRIENLLRLPDGQTLQMVCWTDRKGDILKSRTETLDLERIRATKELALAKTELPELDLVADVAVDVDRPLAGAHDTKRVRYRVHLEGADPAKEFVPGPSQRIKSVDPHTIELTVYAIRPGQPGGNPDAPADPPTDDDRQPNSMIQSDNARIVADAAAATAGETDPWRVALALERYVHREVARQNFSFSQAFATAAEVAETRSGDCSENAVFLAALARARGIPARVAVGLVYMQGRQAFGYHMWTEVNIQGRWIPLDATLGQGGIGAAHLKVNHSNLKGSSAYSSFLPLVKIIGRLKIKVLEVESLD